MFEALTGPAAVVTQTMSNSWSAPIIDRKTETRIVGPSSGRVMYRIACQRVAPSIGGRLLELARDALEAGQQQDHVEAEVLPRDDDEQGEHHDRWSRPASPGQAAEADRRQGAVDEAVRLQEQLPDDAR